MTMLRLIGATALAYVGYRVGHRILMESGTVRDDADGLSSNGWPPARTQPDYGTFDDPEARDTTVAGEDLLPEDTEEALSGGPSDRPGSSQS
jgi:hypothetical protein